MPDKDEAQSFQQRLIGVTLTPVVPDAQRQADVLRMLQQITVHALATLGEPTLPLQILEQVCALLGASSGALYRLEPDEHFTLVACSQTPRPHEAYGNIDSLTLAQRLAASRQPLVIDCAHDPQARETICGGGDCPRMLCVPLEWQQQSVGVLHLVDERAQHRIGADDLWLLSQVADLVALVVLQHERHFQLLGTRDSRHLTVPARPNALFTAVEAMLRQSQQMQEALHMAIAAAEHERMRIARDLHDGLRQSLFGVQVQLEAVSGALSNTDIHTALEQIRAGQELLAAIDLEMRRIVEDLAPVTLLQAGLIPALREHVAHWQRLHGMRIELSLPDHMPDLAEPAATALYRIVQEALANCARHAHARQVTVALTASMGELLLTISDDGQGGATTRLGGLGLHSMRERARAIGATLQLLSPPGEGTLIIVTLPLHPNPTQAADENRQPVPQTSCCPPQGCSC